MPSWSHAHTISVGDDRLHTSLTFLSYNIHFLYVLWGAKSITEREGNLDEEDDTHPIVNIKVKMM